MQIIIVPFILEHHVLWSLAIFQSLAPNHLGNERNFSYIVYLY